MVGLAVCAGGVRRGAAGKKSHLQTIHEEEVLDETHDVSEPLVATMSCFSVSPGGESSSCCWWRLLLSPRAWCHGCIGEWGRLADEINPSSSFYFDYDY